MSDMKATVAKSRDGFHVEGYEKIEYDFVFIDNVFDPSRSDLADCYKPWKRCLAVMDANIFDVYGEDMQRYFDHHDIQLDVHKTMIGEKAKSIDTYLSIVDSMTQFGIYRKEPVLVIGGGLVTDIAGFACASYRRNTPYIRIPTTVIGLIDASVSIKVAVNYGNYKNRLGAYHAPTRTFLDFGFLRTLPVAQTRNGFAELIKISSCADLATFDLLDQYCEELISTGFGRKDGASKEVRMAADAINESSIYEMLKLETPNLHEIGLDRVIAYGHTWSPLHELIPEPALRHGAAISVDMAYSATLANTLGLLGDAEHMRLLRLFSKAGLPIDHPQFDEDVLDRGTKAILRTRDGSLRLAVPSPLGSCNFINDFSYDQLFDALKKHKQLAQDFPRQGAGLESYVDASDTGYTFNGQTPDIKKSTPNGAKKINVLNDDAKAVNGVNGHASNGVNGHATNGINGHASKGVNGHAPNGVNGVNGSVKKAEKFAAGIEEDAFLSNGNGHIGR
ncbi:hypothetical protein BDY17DRAFT_243928 [Neohortaea acidophila]|uniref:Uncharacterized protein n=1 Tax=Neohortaea acidophila TaxID=245834 RepID=A0A6A6Q3K8_9PEZI|nr:uncharacterized protein BDY17DRAFT_243928 [Neohortaea acidophila]KAF2486980.1 hypothetical protein BDY17DRAFT_243928 [Neohortaea acidophila]